MKKVLFFLAMLAVGGFLGVTIGALTKNGLIDVKGLHPLVVMGYLMLAFYVQIIIHESGHLVFGLLARFKLYSFRVSYLAIQNENNRLKLKVFKNAGYLGLCIMIPTRQEMPKSSFLLYFVGGLLFNFLTFLICAALILSGVLNGPFVAATAFFGLFFFITNALPFTSKGNLKTDGLHCFNALKNNAAHQDNVRLFSINALLMSGVRPAELPATHLELHTQTLDPATKVHFLMYDYFHYLDIKNYLKALASMQEAEKHLHSFPKAQLKEIQAEVLFAYCFLQNHPEKAQDLYSEIRARLETDHTVSGNRVKAAYELFITGNAEKGLEFLAKGSQVLHEYIMKGLIPMEEALLTALTQKFNSERSSVPEVIAAETAI